MSYWDRIKNKHEYQALSNPPLKEETKKLVKPKPEDLTNSRVGWNDVEKDQKICFAHIPTFGGGIIQEVARSSDVINYHHHAAAPVDGKHFCTKHKKRRNSYRPFFSIVGNPFEWLIRLWFHNWLSGDGLAKDIHPQNVWPDLETFLYEFNSNKDAWANEWNRKNQHKYPLFSFRHLQVCQTFDTLNDFDGIQFEGEYKKFSYAKFYGRVEMLDRVLDILHLPSKNIKNDISYGDYRKYYDTKLIDHISEHRKQELDLLGYDFEGPTDELALFEINKPFIWNT